MVARASGELDSWRSETIIIWHFPWKVVKKRNVKGVALKDKFRREVSRTITIK